jgi:tetratricopeptide (TPR) repeat protein
MRNISILKLALILILVTILPSCKKYLDLNPISEYNAGEFYKTQQDFELASQGLYVPLLTITNSELPKGLEARSDNVDAFHPYQYNNGYAILSMFTDDAQTPALDAIWTTFWTIISRSNAILDQIDAAQFNDETRRANLKGEAYFFRGYAYFQLGWMFGGVPLLDRQLKVSEIATIKRSTQEETLNFAAGDLKKASEMLPQAWEAKELGKSTKYAASGILARLYMFQKKYDAAKPLLSSIISSGKYAMASTYKDCFIETMDNSPEHLFQVQFTGNNAFVVSLAPVEIRNTMFPTGGGSAMNVSYDLYNSYEAGDIRRDFTILKGFNTVSNVVDNITLVFVKFARGQIPAVKTAFNVNFPILRYTDVKMMYAEALNEEAYNPSGEAFAILNEVRKRGGLTVPLTSAQIPTQDAFRNAILKERRAEFACEGLRWFDLLRTGKAMSVMNTFFARPDQGSGTYKMQDFRAIFAIPQYEINLNPNKEYMWQNPQY